MTLAECRRDKANILRNIRRAERDGWTEHAELLRRTFARCLAVKLPRCKS